MRLRREWRMTGYVYCREREKRAGEGKQSRWFSLLAAQHVRTMSFNTACVPNEGRKHVIWLIDQLPVVYCFIGLSKHRVVFCQTAKTFCCYYVITNTLNVLSPLMKGILSSQGAALVMPHVEQINAKLHNF